MGSVFLMLLGALVLMGVSAGFGYWFGSGGRQSGSYQVQKEYDDYRDRVNDHFAKTAEHFETIGREYRALYQHMATGADALCDVRDSGKRLSFDPQPAAGPVSRVADSDDVEDPPAPGDSPPAATRPREEEPVAADDPGQREPESGETAESAGGTPAESEAAAGEAEEAATEGATAQTADDGDEAAEPTTPEKRARDADADTAIADTDDADSGGVPGTNGNAESAQASAREHADESAEKARELAPRTPPASDEIRVGESAAGEAERTYH